MMKRKVEAEDFPMFIVFQGELGIPGSTIIISEVYTIADIQTLATVLSKATLKALWQK